MEITAIRSERDYRRAMKRIDALLARVGRLSATDDRALEALSILAADWEERNTPIEELPPVEYLQQHMEQFGRRQADLAELLGSRSLASEIMNRHRAMSLEVIRKISAAWNIPIGILAAPYEIERRRA